MIVITHEGLIDLNPARNARKTDRKFPILATRPKAFVESSKGNKRRPADQKHRAGPQHVLKAKLGKQSVGVRWLNGFFESSVGKTFIACVAKLRPTFQKRCSLACQLGRVPLVVVIQKGDPFAVGSENASISRRARSPILLVQIFNPRTVGSEYFAGVIGRTIVDNNYLNRRKSLVQHARDGLINPARVVVRGYDNCDRKRRHLLLPVPLCQQLRVFCGVFPATRSEQRSELHASELLLFSMVTNFRGALSARIPGLGENATRCTMRPGQKQVWYVVSEEAT